MGHHDLTTATIEQKLLQSESVIARERASQMSLLRELDRRQVALRDGHRSLQEWAAGRMDVAPETARMLVTTARRLQDLPDIDEAVACGEIGFDRGRRGVPSRGPRQRPRPVRATRPGMTSTASGP